MGNRTCGVYYQEAMNEILGEDRDPKKVRLFAAGFVIGQAEKIFLGACSAAMFRPSPEYRSIIDEAVHVACKVYKLYAGDIGNEIWILGEGVEWRFNMLVEAHRRGEINTDLWHRTRGDICGVPWFEIDPEFHKREGYNEHCDK